MYQQTNYLINARQIRGEENARNLKDLLRNIKRYC